MSESQYIPGVCNINHAEIAYRRKFAIGSVVITVVLLVVLTVMGTSTYIRALVIFLPLLIASINILQVRNKFCVSYASSGQQNADDGHQGGVAITDETARAADKRKARKMNLQALAFSLAIALISIAVPAYSH